MNYFIGKIYGILQQFSTKRFAAALLQVYGAIWLFLEATDFFYPVSSNNLKSYWWVFLIIGIITGLIHAWPKLSISAKIRDTDSFIEIRVIDMFAVDASYIMGTTRTFDTSKETVSPNSTQGQFTKLFFNDTPSLLDIQIESSLKNIPYKDLPEEKKKAGKRLLYPVGTVAKVVGDKGKRAYLVAFMTLNEKGVGCKAELEDFQFALTKIWEDIKEYGDVSHLLCCGILGSAFSRLKLTREELIRKIIKSFIAESRKGNFCDRLIIAIYPPDFQKGMVSFDRLRQIIEYESYYKD